MNRVILLGRLGGDPELRTTNNGQAVLNFTLATSRRVKARDSDTWEERTEWHRIVFWGKRAEGLAKVLSKGLRVMIEGELRTRAYLDREQQKRFQTQIFAESLEFADGKRESDAARKEPLAPSEHHGPPEDDDIPF